MVQAGPPLTRTGGSNPFSTRSIREAAGDCPNTACERARTSKRIFEVTDFIITPCLLGRRCWAHGLKRRGIHVHGARSCSNCCRVSFACFASLCVLCEKRFTQRPQRLAKNAKNAKNSYNARRSIPIFPWVLSLRSEPVSAPRAWNQVPSCQRESRSRLKRSSVYRRSVACSAFPGR